MGCGAAAQHQGQPNAEAALSSDATKLPIVLAIPKKRSSNGWKKK
jgi:hypothetical protein